MLNEVERNYEIYDKEMMVIMDSLSDWCQYLLGAKEPVEIWTDHQNLQYFKKPQKLNCHQARWVMEISEYIIQLYHKPGKTMGKAIPLEPWETMGMDLIGELPKAGGYDTIAVFTCHLTKCLRLVAMHMACTSEGMARIYKDKIFPIHGLP